MKETNTQTEENKNESLKVVTINVGSNAKNIERVITKYKDYDIIGITEAGLTNQKVIAKGVEDYNIWAIPRTKTGAKDSILLLVHKDWEATSINTGMKRSKSVRVNIRNNETINIHLIYGPPNTNEKKEYWTKWIEYLTNQEESNRKNILLGDLNNIVNTEKDRLGNTNPDQYSLSELIHETGVVDIVQQQAKETRFTWMRTSEGVTQASRIDHILIDPVLTDIVAKTNIQSFDRNLSPDHAAVTATLKIQDTTKIKDRSSRVPQLIEVVDTEKLKENCKRYNEEIRALVETRRDEDRHCSVAEKWERLASGILEISKQIGGVKKREINGNRVVHASNKEKSLRENLKRLSRSIGSSLHLKRGDPATRRIKTLDANRPEYKISRPTDGDWEKWRKDVMKVQSQLAKELEKEETKTTNKKIRKLVKELRESQKTNPRNFFKKLKGVTQKGSLYRVRTEEGKRIAKASEVKEEIAKVWGKMWQDKPHKETKDCTWFQTAGFQKLKEKVEKTDTKMKPATNEEVMEAINCYSKRNKAPGVDNIVPELIVFAKEELLSYMTEIFNLLLLPGIDGKRSEIPRDWKLTRIFLLYKESPISTEENPLDYRPISLLCVPFKIFVTLIERRLRKIHEPFFTETQGGFRPNRSCSNKSLTVANLLEDANKYNKPIHICFLDIAKAYDSVNPEEVTDTMFRMGYDLETLDLLDHINTSCRGRVMTPHGDTDEFYFQGGLRQGDPLSPLLFIIFLEPLLIQLGESGKGYVMEQTDNQGNNITIESESFADDQAIIGKSNEELQDLFNVATDFYNYYKLRLNLSSKNKTAYMTTSRDENENIIYTKQDNITQIVPKLEKEETYTYLGIKVNSEASWEPMEKAISSTIGLHLLNIRNRAITPLQKVYIVNRVLIPAIEYRLQIVEVGKKILQMWNARIARSMLRSCGWEYRDGFEVAFHPQSLGGLGLSNLHDVDLQAKIQSYITLGTNGIDLHTRRTLEGATKETPNRVTRLNKKLKRLKMRIEKLTHEQPNNIGCVTPFIKNETAKKISPEHNNLKTATKFNFYLNNNLVHSIKKQLEPWQEKFPEMLELISEGPHSLPKELFSKDETEENTYEAWTDGSYNPVLNTAGSAFITHYIQGRGESMAVRSPYSQKSYAAELYAIWLLLKMARPDFHLTVYVDNESAIKIATSKERTEREKRKDPLTPLIEEIRALIENRKRAGTRVVLKHVYSHILEGEGNSMKEKLRRIELMKDRYGEGWKEIAMGNAKADEEATKALTSLHITHSITSIRYAYGLVDCDESSKEKYQTGLRKMVKEKIQRTREAAAKEDLKKKMLMDVEKGNFPLLRLDEEMIAREQVFLIKLVWGRLKTKDRMHGRVVAEEERRNAPNRSISRTQEKWEEENKEKIEVRKKMYAIDAKCPLGCDETETIKHVLTCNNNEGPKVHEGLKTILHQIDGTSKWKVEEPWTVVLKGEEVGHKGKLQKLTEQAVAAGLMPNNLEKFLTQNDQEDPPARVKKIFVQKELLEIYHRRWILRCKKMFKKEKEKTKNNNNQRRQPKTTNTNQNKQNRTWNVNSRKVPAKKKQRTTQNQKRPAPTNPDATTTKPKKRKTTSDFIRERYTNRLPFFIQMLETQTLSFPDSQTLSLSDSRLPDPQTQNTTSCDLPQVT